MISEPEIQSEQGPLRVEHPDAGRLPYEPPRLVYLGAFRDLTKGGGLTGDDTTFFGTRPG
jgi:hypothetical protein